MSYTMRYANGCESVILAPSYIQAIKQAKEQASADNISKFALYLNGTKIYDFTLITE